MANLPIKITYTLRKIVNGGAVADAREEVLDGMPAAENRAKAVLQLPEIFGSVQFWGDEDREGELSTHRGSMG